jgi:pyruvate-formate lyase
MALGCTHWPDKAEFYEAEERLICAVQGWISRTVEAIEAALERETNPALEANLREMAEVNRWLIDGPPRRLREACQWIAWYNMASRTYNRDGAGRQLDELLRPYYERDRRDPAGLRQHGSRPTGTRPLHCTIR